MKYVQPYGITDPDASYINGDPSIGRLGSIPPAEAFEHPMREIVGVIEKNAITPVDTDLLQMMKGIRSQRMNFAQDTGTVNSVAVAFDPPLTAYSIGLPIRVKIASSNTGPSQINAGAGNVQIRRPNGAQLSAGDLPAGGMVDLVYDGTAFQMINFGQQIYNTYVVDPGEPPPEPPPPQVYLYNIPYAVDSGTANAVVANFPAGAITSLTAGTICLVKIAATNTAPSTLNVNGLGAHEILANGGGSLIYSDLQAGNVHFFRYDGNYWWTDPSPAIVGAASFSAASNAQVSDLFVRLSRKRIASNASVTITLASGVYDRIDTYHVDADRITLQGTMIGAAPTRWDFAMTGNSAAARGNDAANNLAMLRSRFGTEIRATQANMGALRHHGPGMITYQNLLVTGENTLSPSDQPVYAVHADGSCSMTCNHVCIWGANCTGFTSYACSMVCNDCYTSSAQKAGFSAGVGGNIAMYNSGAFGGAGNGLEAFENGVLHLFIWAEAVYNANYGILLSGLGMGQFYVNGTAIGSGNVDIYAGAMGMFYIPAGCNVGSTSPVRNVTGNYNSIIVAS